jgi:F-type H+-transporting ATPase subunit delta
MTNPRLAGRYAKSLLDLAIEQNQLEVIYADIKWLNSVCVSNPDFVAMLKSPIIKSDIKTKVIDAISAEKLNALTSSFLRLLVNKTREYNLPEIAIAFIQQYNKLNDIHPISLLNLLNSGHQIIEERSNEEEGLTSTIKSGSNIQSPNSFENEKQA